MDAPKEVFALESLNGKIWIHSTRGPLIFVELEDAKAALQADNGRLEKKWSVFTAAMTPELSSAPFRDYKEETSDTMALPKNSLYLADLRDQVAQSKNQDVIGSIMPDVPSDAEYLELRAKLKNLNVNIRAVRKLSTLREMLKKAEAEAVTV